MKSSAVWGFALVVCCGAEAFASHEKTNKKPSELRRKMPRPSQLLIRDSNLMLEDIEFSASEARLNFLEWREPRIDDSESRAAEEDSTPEPVANFTGVNNYKDLYTETEETLATILTLLDDLRTAINQDKQTIGSTVNPSILIYKVLETQPKINPKEKRLQRNLCGGALTELCLEVLRTLRSIGRTSNDIANGLINNRNLISIMEDQYLLEEEVALVNDSMESWNQQRFDRYITKVQKIVEAGIEECDSRLETLTSNQQKSILFASIFSPLVGMAVIGLLGIAGFTLYSNYDMKKTESHLGLLDDPQNPAESDPIKSREAIGPDLGAARLDPPSTGSTAAAGDADRKDSFTLTGTIY